MTTSAPQIPIQYTLTITNGVEKGTVYKLMAREITIGRGSENNISIPYDLRCSRVHARIVFTSKGVKIMNMSDKNYIKINGKNKKKAYLTNNAQFTLGQTKFNFSLQSNIEGISTEKILKQTFQLSSNQPSYLQVEPNISKMGTEHDELGFSKASTPKKSSGRIKFYSFLGIIALLIFALAQTDSKKRTKKAIELSTKKRVTALIKKNAELDVAYKKKQGKTRTQIYRQSQEHYLKGFRDFRLGLYDRALDAFQACLSIYIDHPLCNRYLKLSQRKQGELAQYHMSLGRRYLDQGQYRPCLNAFENVQFIIKNKANPLYKEAVSNLKICKTRLEARY